MLQLRRSAAYGVQVLGIVQKPLTASMMEPLLRGHFTTPLHAAVPPAGTAPPMLPKEILRGLLDDEFEPFFQPKIEIATGRVCGAEALARWQHPAHGVLNPGSFIETMTRHGLLDALTWLMLRKASDLHESLRAHGGSGSIAANLRVSSLAVVGAAEKITALVLERVSTPGTAWLRRWEELRLSRDPCAPRSA